MNTQQILDEVGFGQMTDEQIIALVKEYFQEGGIRDDGGCCEWFATTDAVLKFAQEVYEEGYDEGCFQATGGNG